MPIRTLLITFLIMGSFVYGKPTRQSSCKYWIKYLDQVSQWEKAKLKCLERGDIKRAHYYSLLIKREIEDVADDAQDFEN